MSHPPMLGVLQADLTWLVAYAMNLMVEDLWPADDPRMNGALCHEAPTGGASLSGWQGVDMKYVHEPVSQWIVDTKYHTLETQ